MKIYNLYYYNFIEELTIMLIFSFILTLVLIIGSYLLTVRKPDAEKLSPYE